MGKLNVYNFISLNGYFKGANEDISWHQHGKEENEYAAKSLQSESSLLFGRVTYEMMASYWPSPMAIQNDPDVAEGMNSAEKIVFSKTLKDPAWNNTRVVKDMLAEVKKMKEIPGKLLTVLGSGSIISQLADHGLIDEYLIMIDPVVLSEGTPIFKGISRQLDFKLTDSKSFKSGVVLLSYRIV